MSIGLSRTSGKEVFLPCISGLLSYNFFANPKNNIPLGTMQHGRNRDERTRVDY